MREVNQEDTYSIDVVKPSKNSIQSLYLGERSFRALSLVPGDLVSINNQIIARCFLHPIREVTGLTCEGGVRVVGDSALLSLNLTTPLTSAHIVKLKVVKVDQISVIVVLTKYNRECTLSTTVLKDVLHDVGFVHNALVSLESSRVANLHGIAALKISVGRINPGECYITSNQCDIRVNRIFSKTYIELKGRNQFAPKVGGVGQIYTRMHKAILQRNQHLLLSAPSGAGKSCLTGRLAADLGYPLISLESSDIGVGVGVVEGVFTTALEVAQQDPDNPGVLVLIKNIDAAGGRKGIHQMQAISRLISCLEKNRPKDNIIVIATTSKPEEVDLSLRRPGRLGLEFFMKVPTEEERHEILVCILAELNFNLKAEMVRRVAGATRGFLASDLALLANRILSSGSEEWEAVQKCIDVTIPSGLKLGLGWVNLEKISWQSIGGMEDTKKKLIRAIEWPIRKPEAFKRLGIKPSKGVLLYGPPGCGKTRLVRAAASNTGATLLSVSGAEIYSPYVGDSEKAIVELFRQARLGAPTILFIDEIDTLVSARDMDGSKTNHSDKVLSALLTEMDGMGGKEQDGLGSGQVLVVGATNRPASLDSALTRPGRLDTLLYIPAPDTETRLSILETHLARVPAEKLDLGSIAERTANYSGADLENLVREAVLHLLTQEGMAAQTLKMENLLAVLEQYRPSLSSSTLAEYTEYIHST